MAIDPVCGMTVEEVHAPATAEHAGRTYYFCAPGCKRKFLADPQRVLREGPKGMGIAPAQPAPVQMVTLGTLKKASTRATPSSPSTITIPIEGMSCASCVARIEHGLSQRSTVGDQLRLSGIAESGPRKIMRLRLRWY